MTAQQHADHLLHVWQEHRKLPPLLRLQKIACLEGPLMPVPVRVAAQGTLNGTLDRTLAAVDAAMQEPPR